MGNFTELLPNPRLLKNLQELNYQKPTAIQEQAIPVALNKQDILAIAQTGTGKTAAFCLPIFHNLSINPTKSLRALILVPTRELAFQIQGSLEKYGKELNIPSTAIFGGVGQATQTQAIKKGAEIIVATPGRLLDLMSQDIIRLNKIEILVLDEADRMLDMGFLEDLEKIFKNLPEKRQTMFFSATMPPAVLGLSRKILKNPKRIEVSRNSSTVDKVQQRIIHCKRDDKFQLLKKILKEEKRDLVVVFTKTKNSADKVQAYLRFHKMASTVYHGDKSQNDREQALETFKAGGIKILIATDIAARGLDIEGVSHVINFELPLEAESYVHRIGRTARAGKTGVAITFCDDSEIEIFERIKKMINQQLPLEKYKGSPEAKGVWNQDGSIRKAKAPTPGKSQEKTAYLDHSKRQRETPEGAPKPSKSHPGFKNRNKKKRR
jgi:ATP-dependent RNA helicase RhlE